MDGQIGKTLQVPKHKPPTRNEQTADKKRLVLEIIQLYPTRPERIAAWAKCTGLRERAFYNLLAELKAEGKLPPMAA